MTACTEQLTKLLTAIGAKDITFSRSDFTGAAYVRFVLNGKRETRWGTSPADLLTRIEAWLKTHAHPERAATAVEKKGRL